MAKIFEDRTTAFDGSASPSTGDGVVTVYFSVNKSGFSSLKIWARKESTTDDYVNIKEIDKSSIFKFDADGIQYYFTWDLTGVGGLATQTISATLDV